MPPLDYDHNGYFSVIEYDAMGWLDVEEPCLPGSELERNPDGSISVYFGDERCADKPNVIETTKGQEFNHGMRLYRPIDTEETRQFVEALRTNPVRPIQP